MATRELTRPEFEVLNVVALKKMATAGVVAEVLGTSEAKVEETAGALESDDLLGRAGDQLLPTDSAEPALAAFAEGEYADLRAGEGDDVHERFEKINAKLLAAMTSWQEVDVGGQKVANDHSDPDYDEKVIGQVEKLVRRLKPIAETLTEHDERFGRYGERFDAALDRVDRGETDYLSSPTVESVHNLWFEFHEDLLRTLGKERKEA